MSVLEGHTGAVASVSYSSAGHVIASMSTDKSVRLWHSDTCEMIAIIPGSGSNSWVPGLAFHPRRAILATLGEPDTVIRLWDLDLTALLGGVP